MEKMEIEEILQFANEIKRRGGKLVTNYYNNFKPGDSTMFQTYQADNTIVFVYEDLIEATGQVIKRGYFFSNDMKELSQLLKTIPDHIVIDYITRDEKELSGIMQEAGFEEYATFVRISKNYKLADKEKDKKRRESMDSIYNEKYGYWAGKEDIDDILEKMQAVFDPYTYHLCTREQLEDFVKKKWCLIHREQGKIVSIVMFKLEGVKRYGYYMYNDASIDVLYSLQKKVSMLDKENGITYFYGWMDKTNKKAKIVNSFYSIEPDGLYDIIYRN